MNTASKPLRLCIIENGLVPDDLADRFESYPKMIQSWLSSQLPEAEFSVVSAVSEEPLPDPRAYDGYLLTGSKYSVYDGLEWIVKLRAFLQRLREDRSPVFGICFGHQLMAEAYGGSVRKAEQGWGIGAQPYRYRDLPIEEGAAFVFHQDQVVRLPEQVQVKGGSDHCPFGVLEYSFPAMSVQYHPEFTREYVTLLAERYGGQLISKEVAQGAIESLQALPVANDGVAAWVADFFRSACR